mmetsp:Transcript_11176/g.27141  ORF Transcript_11176/g.27141 Transcript_11176/m.27141 type:complete len:91 (-) Transcript_11176:1844-2116(-)
MRQSILCKLAQLQRNITGIIEAKIWRTGVAADTNWFATIWRRLHAWSNFAVVHLLCPRRPNSSISERRHVSLRRMIISNATLRSLGFSFG